MGDSDSRQQEASKSVDTALREYQLRVLFGFDQLSGD